MRKALLILRVYMEHCLLVEMNLFFSSHVVVVIVVKLLNCVQLFSTLRLVAHQAPLSFTISLVLLNFISIESMRLSDHFILCCILLFCLHSFPPPQSFPVSCLFTSGAQNIGASTSATILLLNIQG